VEHHEDGGREVGRELCDDLAERLDPAGRGSDHDDISTPMRSRWRHDFPFPKEPTDHSSGFP
jgi:hypothetical protein